jgi:hypothetical protein
MEEEAAARLIEVMAEEESKGRVLIGPEEGKRPPFRQVFESPMFAVAKCEMGKPIPGKFRQIMHSSWPNPAIGLSMNDMLNIMQRTVSYTAFDKMIRMFLQIGKGGVLFQIDFEKAYRMIPINPFDWPFLGVNVLGRHVVDTRLIFGAGEAPAEFSSFGDCLKWEMQNNLRVPWLEHYLDDFVGGEKSEERTRLWLDILLMELRILGVTVNPDKVRWGRKLIILGIEVDMENMTVSVPQKKAELLCQRIDEVLSADNGMTLRDMRSLTGMIGTCAMVVRQGRVFTQEIHAALADAERVGRGPKHLQGGMIAELKWWKSVLTEGGGVQMMMEETLTKLDPSPLSDASSSWGMGGVCGGKVWQHRWTAAEKQMVDRMINEDARIAIGEMAAVTVSAILFGKEWKGKMVEFRCDNSTACNAVDSGKCRIKRVREMVKELVKITATSSFHIYLRYVPTLCNSSADVLSRQELEEKEIRARGWQRIPQDVVEQAIRQLPHWTT